MTSLPPAAQQLQHLRDLGLIDESVTIEGEGLVVVHPSVAAAADLVALVSRDDKPGFVVPDLTDVEQFAPIDGVEVPDGPVYLVTDPQRGDEMSNWSPDEALPVITGAGRSPMTIHEGLSWLLQQPEMLDRNHCFMTIGSRKPGAKGLDKRTPAIWISNGVERDGGRERRNSAKLGWCWAGNRHTWLGFGSVAGRVAG
ncbi:MAG: hypothetical protein EOO74_04415 [Myxococcales bacterium]|nr:MAG: hypothetical protein EOO74_04415 [Myxococcales bacterium]